MSEATARLGRWRRDLHRIPELALHEHHTGDYLAGELAAMGLEVSRGIGGTGLVATIDRSVRAVDRRGRAVALRAEMDGLALTERADLDHRSQRDGVMHACGHDGHMAMLLGAARVLADDPDLTGTVHLVLQPAEEPGLGARAMVDDGLFGRFPVDAVFALHNFPGHPAGRLSTRPGTIMASEDNFEIRITGRGGHSARPEATVDPIVVAAQVVLGLQTIVARNSEPAAPAVLSCTEVVTDGARNTIPTTATIRGDTRSFAPAVRSLLESRIREVADGICAAHGATVAVTIHRAFAPTVNDPATTDLALAAARTVVGDDGCDGQVAPWTASEDFGVLADEVPGCLMLLGTGTPDQPGGTPLHSVDYDFNDDVLDVGVHYLVAVARATLSAAPPPADPPDDVATTRASGA